MVDVPLFECQGSQWRLSPREREIFGMLAEGMTLQSIADELGLSRETVKTHLRNGASKIGAKTRTAAVVAAIRSGELGAQSRSSSPARASST